MKTSFASTGSNAKCASLKPCAEGVSFPFRAEGASIFLKKQEYTMKIRKLYMALVGILMSTQLANAQQNMLMVGNNGKINAISISSVDYVTFNAKTLAVNPKFINGHKFIDLGLPSGLLWAETNIGAKTAADDGNYYAWGERDTKSTYNESTYFDSNYTTYSIRDDTTLEMKHDAARRNWGEDCRMPTRKEFEELCNSNYCTWTWTSMTASDGSSIDGYKVTSVKNGNSIFLPASGYRNYGKLENHGSFGYYWSSTLASYSSSIAYCLYFHKIWHELSDHGRYLGHPVRPVAEP